MIPDNAFLRRLPSILDGAQAVQLEALVFSPDAVEASFDTIRGVATKYREQIFEADRSVRVALFTHAWTIVDCVHVVLQVLSELDYQTPQTVVFQKRYECACKLRNKMDHLTGNAPNVARSKRRPPVFGALGYICVPDENLVLKDGEIAATGGGIVMLTTGRLAPGQRHRIRAVNPAGLEMCGPVGGFRLEAFDESLGLDEAEHDLRALMIEVNDQLDKQFSERAAVLSKEHGVSVEQLMANPGGGLSVFISFKAGQSC